MIRENFYVFILFLLPITLRHLPYNLLFDKNKFMHKLFTLKLWSLHNNLGVVLVHAPKQGWKVTLYIVHSQTGLQ